MDACIYCRGYGFSADTHEAMAIEDVMEGIATIPCPFCGASPRPMPEYYESLPQRDETREVLKTVAATDTQEAGLSQKIAAWLILAIIVAAVLWYASLQPSDENPGADFQPAVPTQRVDTTLNQSQQQIPQMQQQIRCLEWNQSEHFGSTTHQWDKDCTP